MNNMKIEVMQITTSNLYHTAFIFFRHTKALPIMGDTPPASYSALSAKGDSLIPKRPITCLSLNCKNVLFETGEMVLWVFEFSPM